MARKLTGSIYPSRGSWYLKITLSTGRRTFKLETCRSKKDAEIRRSVIVEVVSDLREDGKEVLAERFCQQAAAAADAELGDLIQLVKGVLAGTEVAVTPRSKRTPTKTTTIREFGDLWTSNELARRYRGRVRAIDHKDNIGRLKRHVYPVVYEGVAIGDMSLEDFTLDHADFILFQETVPDRSLRHVAQCLNRLFTLAVYPCRLLDHSPLPRGWMPKQEKPKAKSYLFPDEEAKLMSHPEAPLVKRVFLGFLAREGPRTTNVVELAWSDLTLELPNGVGYAVLDRTKNGAELPWALDPGTAEALRRWRKLCPSDRWVFPAEAVPRFPRRNRGKPMSVSKVAEELRSWLRAAGVERSKLFEQTDHRMRLRAHDLRSTFVTLSLANGKTEDWVRRRTGHQSTAMIALYRQQAETYAELGLGSLQPLCEAIPELRF